MEKKLKYKSSDYIVDVVLLQELDFEIEALT